LAAICCALAYLAPAQATSVIPLYLEEMIDTSAAVFQGTCTANRTERDAETGFVVTRTTFAVHDVLKGSVGNVHAIKQIGGTIPEEKLEYRVEGVPQFTEGEEYIVFLAGVSAAGFSSPIGLQQGKFSVKSGSAGRQVRNGRDFKDMTARISPLLSETAKAKLKANGPVTELDLEEFKQVVRAQVGRPR